MKGTLADLFGGRTRSTNIEDRRSEGEQSPLTKIARSLPDPSILADVLQYMLLRGKAHPLRSSGSGPAFSADEMAYRPPVGGLDLPRVPSTLPTGGIIVAENYKFGPNGEMITSYEPQAELASVVTPEDRTDFAARKAALRPSISDMYAGIISPSGGIFKGQ